MGHIIPYEARHKSRNCENLIILILSLKALAIPAFSVRLLQCSWLHELTLGDQHVQVAGETMVIIARCQVVASRSCFTVLAFEVRKIKTIMRTAPESSELIICIWSRIIL